ncbi:hypothetical protein C8J57DRAFT_1470801 [Mycena rebaudengoi]|nr:hypothetical protein C8J57DRAFT_1470801 [Mycena rebaudengoi]
MKEKETHLSQRARSFIEGDDFALARPRPSQEEMGHVEPPAAQLLHCRDSADSAHHVRRSHRAQLALPAGWWKMRRNHLTSPSLRFRQFTATLTRFSRGEISRTKHRTGKPTKQTWIRISTIPSPRSILIDSLLTRINLQSVGGRQWAGWIASICGAEHYFLPFTSTPHLILRTLGQLLPVALIWADCHFPLESGSGKRLAVHPRRFEYAPPPAPRRIFLESRMRGGTWMDPVTYGALRAFIMQKDRPSATSILLGPTSTAMHPDTQ